MLSIYEVTRFGKQTRSRILVILQVQDGLTRNELVQASGLTYEQVRRQTRNLVIEGKLRSKSEAGARRYYLATIAIFVLLIPLITPTIKDESINGDSKEWVNS